MNPLKRQPISYSVHRQQMPRGAVFAELFAELDDRLVQGACRPIVLVAPRFIQQAIP